MSRVICTWGNQAELVEALRARVVELGITFAKLDQFAGVADGYTSKVLGPRPTKQLGRMSLETLLSALAVQGGLIEDVEQLKVVQARVPKRKAGPTQQTSTVVITIRNSRLHLRNAGRKGGKARKPRGKREMKRLAKLGVLGRMAKLSPERRSAIAKHARSYRGKSYGESAMRGETCQNSS